MATTCTQAPDFATSGMVTCRKTGETDAWDCDAFAAHLAARSVPLGIGGVGCGEDESGPFVRLHLPGGYDATGDVDAFVPGPNPYLTATNYLRKRAKTIRAKAPGTRTQAENDLLALLVALRQDG